MGDRAASCPWAPLCCCVPPLLPPWVLLAEETLPYLAAGPMTFPSCPGK